MLTLEEQLLFVKEQHYNQIKLLRLLRKQFGDQNKRMFTEQIDHQIFCYVSIVASLHELQTLKENQNAE